MKTHRLAAVLACWSVAVAGCSPGTAIRCALTDLLTEGPGPQPADTRTVAAAAETAPVVDACDAADDPAVWVNEANPEASLIVATNKLRGFVVYGLDGAVVSTREIDAAYVVARCRAAAEEGDVDAQFELGEAYFLGRGRPAGRRRGSRVVPTSGRAGRTALRRTHRSRPRAGPGSGAHRTDARRPGAGPKSPPTSIVVTHRPGSSPSPFRPV